MAKRLNVRPASGLGHRDIERIQQHGNQAVRTDQEDQLADTLVSEQVDRARIRCGRQYPAGGQHAGDVMGD